MRVLWPWVLALCLVAPVLGTTLGSPPDPSCRVELAHADIDLADCLVEQPRDAAGHRVARLTLQVADAQERILALGLPDMFLLHIRRADQGAVLLDLNPRSPQGARPLAHRQLALPLPLQPGEHVFELRYRVHGDGGISPRLLTRAAFARQSVQADLFNGFAAGVLVMLCAIVLIHHWAGGPSSNLAYIVLIATEVAGVAQIEGYNFAFLWPDSPRWNNAAPSVLCMAALAAHAGFAIRFLQLRARYPWLWRLNVLWAGLASVVTLVLCAWFGGEALDGMVWADRLMGGWAVSYGLLAIVTGWRAARDGLPGASLYLLGVGALALFSFLLFPLAIVGQELLPAVTLATYPKLGLMFEAAFFSAALVNRVRRFQDERAEARTRRLAEAEELLRAEEAKRAALEQARAQSLQLASASHDISQPLASLRFAIAALREREAGAADISAHLDRSLSYAETLLRDIIEQARAELPAHDDHIELGSLFAQLCEAWQAQALAQGLYLGYADTVLELDASALIVSRLLNNLLSNALRYTPRGRVLLGARRREGGIELQVLDTGPGMLPEQIERLTRPFERGHADGEGFGLGLFIVRSLCAQCGYELRVRSVLGRGTCFGVWIPTA